MRQPHHRGHQHVEHRLLGLDVVVEEALLETEAGVVDQQLDGALGVAQPRLDGGELRAVDEVGDEDLDGDAVRRPQLLGHDLEPRAVTGDEHEVVSAAGEPVGEGESDASGRAGHEGCIAHGSQHACVAGA